MTSIQCDGDETVVIDYGELAAGQAVNASATVSVAEDTLRGTLMPLVFEANYEFGGELRSSRVVLENVAGTLIGSDLIFADGFE